MAEPLTVVIIDELATPAGGSSTAKRRMEPRSGAAALPRLRVRFSEVTDNGTEGQQCSMWPALTPVFR
jgi:hypothetical protein